MLWFRAFNQIIKLKNKIKMELQIGKIYDVFSSRKGKFRIKLTSQCETWATGIITKGKAKAICEYNEREKGEEITVRKELSSFTEVF